MDCIPPGSSVLWIFQARILEWIAISFSRGSSQPRDWTHVSCISGLASRFFTSEPLGKSRVIISIEHFLLKVLSLEFTVSLLKRNLTEIREAIKTSTKALSSSKGLRTFHGKPLLFLRGPQCFLTPYFCATPKTIGYPEQNYIWTSQGVASFFRVCCSET